VAGQPYPVRVLDLPTIVESYKTYDDINLVKTGDVGQVRRGVLQLVTNQAGDNQNGRGATSEVLCCL
jgi:TATA-binding protein-associated factor Taf7